ncbi:MAG: hypothetical protein PF542_06550 [Nanoarchaeota archaeon]|jgi:hypothetical protein|nr:hypothetical protein [Nanoarchaeota archaeon]
MKITKRIHPGYEEFEKIKEEGLKIRKIFGKYQYFYSSNKGEISLISLPNYILDGEIRWEIYCLEGNLFEDVIAFHTKKEAECFIEKYLTKQTK